MMLKAQRDSEYQQSISNDTALYSTFSRVQGIQSVESYTGTAILAIVVVAVLSFVRGVYRR
jgi:hypothetical protein